jgi:hypothetical protein
VVTKHLDFYGRSALEADWYEDQLAGIETTFGDQLEMPHLRFVDHGEPACDPYCLDDDGAPMIACSSLDGDCNLRVAQLAADTLGRGPLLLRDGLAEVLAGGVGDADFFTGPVHRDALDPEALLDDETYTALRRDADPFDWEVQTRLPAADLVRYLVDLDPAAFIAIYRGGTPAGGWAATLSGWRASPETSGRRYRIPLAECAEDRDLAFEPASLDTFDVVPAYAPDVGEPMYRGVVASFVLHASAVVQVEVHSGVGGDAYFRVETCDPSNAPRFVVTRADSGGPIALGHSELPEGRYFIIAGSDGSVGPRTEGVFVKLIEKVSP